MTPVATTPVEADVWEDNVQMIFETVSELPTYWADRERPFAAPHEDGLCLLQIIDERGWGVDEARTVYDAAAPVGAECRTTLSGLRRLDLQVQVETFDHDAQRSARFFLGQIRTRLRRAATLAALRKISTSLIETTPILVAGGVSTADARRFSISTMVVSLHRAIEEPDAPVGFIDQIEVVRELQDQGGVDLGVEDFVIDLPDP